MSLQARWICLAAFAVVAAMPVCAAAEDVSARVDGALSPYVRAHAKDGVDWYGWGSDAFERARDKKRPVFLLLGRSGSYRDRVIERAFLEQPATRETLSKKCVAVVVDRDERPDLDDALRLVARLGAESPAYVLDGPLAALLSSEMRLTMVRPLTPDMAGDLDRLVRVARERDEDIEMRAEHVAAALDAAQRPAPGRLTEETLARVVARTIKAFHPLRGTYTLSPVRPSPAVLGLLLAEAERTHRADLVRLASRALTTLAKSGLHDHVGGGFFRSAGDADLSLPRFEKTLVDNALLLDVFVREYALTGDALARETARDTADWVLREMREPSGALTHGLDAEDPRGEGRQYLWTGEELRAILGRDGATAFFRAYRLSGGGILTLITADGTTPQPEIERLRAKRLERPRSFRDDRVFAGETGLMIAALARSARVLDRASDRSAARRAAEVLFEQVGPPEQLHRSSRGGVFGGRAMLDDYAGLMLGLLALDEAAPDPRWNALAVRLADEAIRRLLDPAGGFFLTEEAHTPYIVRVKSADDAGRVSANALMAEALLRLEAVSGQKRYGQIARQTVEAFLGDLARDPFRMEGLAQVASDLLAAGPRTTAVALPPATGRAREARGPVAAQLALATDRGRPLEPVDATVYLSLTPPWEIIAAQTKVQDLAPLSVSVVSADFIADTPRYPTAQTARRRWSPKPVPVLSGMASIALPLRPQEGSRPGEHRLRVRLFYQRCDPSTCQPPESLTLEAPFTVVAEPAASPEPPPTTQ